MVFKKHCRISYIKELPQISVLNLSLSGHLEAGKAHGHGKTEEITQNKELVNY